MTRDMVQMLQGKVDAVRGMELLLQQKRDLEVSGYQENEMYLLPGMLVLQLVITAIQMYHLCHCFYQGVTRNLPLIDNLFTTQNLSYNEGLLNESKTESFPSFSNPKLCIENLSKKNPGLCSRFIMRNGRATTVSLVS